MPGLLYPLFIWVFKCRGNDITGCASYMLDWIQFLEGLSKEDAQKRATDIQGCHIKVAAPLHPNKYNNAPLHPQ